MTNLPIRQATNATERAGVNHVRTIIEGANCIFHEIHRENDYGNDAFVEFVDGQQVTGVSVALQVKSGASYCPPSTCTIPITERQWNYWSNGDLPVVGVVYDPDERNAYWVGISGHLERDSGRRSIVFEKSEATLFDQANFTDIFMPLFVGDPPRLPFDKSLRFARAPSDGMHAIGIRSLFYRHRNRLETWETFAELLRTRPTAELDPILAYFLAHVPGHGDVLWGADSIIDEAVRERAKELMSAWGQREVLQLLRLMDDNGVERGSIGQSVYAIVDLTIKGAGELVRSVLDDSSVETDTRRSAMLLFYLMEQQRIEPVLQHYLNDPDLGDSAGIMLEYIRSTGPRSAS